MTSEGRWLCPLTGMPVRGALFAHSAGWFIFGQAASGVGEKEQDPCAFHKIILARVISTVLRDKPKKRGLPTKGPFFVLPVMVAGAPCYPAWTAIWRGLTASDFGR
jgi:hypothetical protein